MSARNIIHVNFTTQPIHEIAAIVLVSLLYSEPGDTDDDRAYALAILCARALHGCTAGDALASSSAQIRPGLALLSIDEVNRRLVDINRRIRRRWIAGEMVLPFLEIAATDKCPAMEHLGKRTTVNNVAELVLKNAPASTPEDVKKRIWAASKQVLHLAAAFSFEKYTRAVRSEPFDFDAFFWDPVFVARIIAAAELYEPLLEKSIASGRLRVQPESLIRLRAAAA